MSLDPQLLHQLYYGPVADRLTQAETLFQEYRDVFCADTTLEKALEKLRADATSLNEHMASMNMGPLCVACSSGAGGGCCSLYMAGETDGIQLLMNMLAGVQVAKVRNDGVECCYLGERGCIFLFKPMFCLNYNCAKITGAALPADLAGLEQLTGRLLTRQYEVEKLLLAIMSSQIKR